MFKYFGFGDNNDLHAEVQRWKKFSKITNKIIFSIKTETYLDMAIYIIQWEALLFDQV